MTSYARQKGSKNVRRCKEYLESQGWTVAKCELGGKFTKEKDLFGLGDLVAIIPPGNSSNPTNSPIWMIVQVTSNKPHTLKAYTDFAQKHCSAYHFLRQYVWVDRKGWKIYTFHSTGDYSVTTVE